MFNFNLTDGEMTSITFADVVGWTDSLELFRLTHDQLILQEGEKDLLPVRALRTVMTDYFAGRTFQGNALMTVREVEDDSHPAMTHLRRGAFLTGVASARQHANGRFEVIDSARIASTGLKYITRAFLHLRQEDFFRVFSTVDAAHEPFLHHALAGALSEAHVATLVVKTGYTIRFPTTEEDLLFGVDWIVPFGDGSCGVVLQVKSNVESSGIEFVAVTQQNAFHSPSGPNLFRDGWSKTQGFNEAYNVSYSPAIAYVVSTSDRRFHFDRQGNIDVTRAFLTSLAS